MAKPIKPTPILRGKDALRFLKKIYREDKNPNPERIRFIQGALKKKFKVVRRV